MGDLAWYASYGSNLLLNRFLCYITGGRPERSEKCYKGCSDKSSPKDCKQITLPFELYFSKKSRSWENKGVAFVKSRKDERARTYGRRYLITKEQLVEILRQESGRNPNDESINIDFETAISKRSSLVPNIVWYGRIMHLGSEDDYPIFTFTGTWTDENIVPTPPGEKYLKILIKGIKETYGLPDENIIKYLKKAEGIRERIDKQDIIRIVESVNI